jgi:hypothetical protein
MPIMSRSKHTDPRWLRASRRVRGPFDRRDTDDLSLRRKLRPRSPSGNSTPAPRIKRAYSLPVVPRIIWHQPRPGFHYPITKQDVLTFLETIGSLAVYGLRSIEFTRGRISDPPVLLLFGRYETPGRILLFEQARSPWRLHGRLSKKDVNRFERAGAKLIELPQSGTTLVDWPADTLGRFMLEEVLLHEMGHHVLQHHKGKRLDRIARTKDHEAFAALFSMRQQKLLAVRSRAT